MSEISYCIKCKMKKEMHNIKEMIMKNGKNAYTGVCPDCGTKMFKIHKKIQTTA